MRFSELVFSNSPWWILVAIAAGLGYAWLLYSRNGPWGKTLERLLFALRVLVVFAIAVLLINPLLKQIKNTSVKPLAVVVLDNSTSISESVSSSKISEAKANINLLIDQLKAKGFQVVIRDLDSELSTLDSFKITQESTNISNALKNIESIYDEGALRLAVLVSDGIYNLGTSPGYLNYPFEIYTLGLGDTIPKKDVTIKNVRYNKVATQGNKFPIEIEVLQNGFDNSSIPVNLSLGGNIIDSKRLSFDGSINIQTLEFIVDTELTGLNRFTLNIPPQKNEQVASNNRKDIYIDIIDNKDKILLLGSSPHPDLKALKSAIEKNKNYEVHVHIPGVNEFQEENYGAMIVHKPFSGNRQADQILETQLKAKTPVWYILGRNTNYRRINQISSIIQVEQIRGQYDNVGAVLTSNFSKFKIEEDGKQLVEDYPPIKVPYGNIKFKVPTETFMTQRIGNIVSGKPLLVLSNSVETKEAILLGSGIWQWRIQEFAKDEEFGAFDLWVSKLVQYLNTSEDKKRFRVSTSSDEYTDSEAVIFKAEAYNNIYENIYNVPIELEIHNESNTSVKYSFVTTESNSEYKIGGLEPGVYTYTATTSLSGKNEVVKGGFSVVELQIESINLTADFNLLRRLARKTGGKFSPVHDKDTMLKQYEDLKAQGIIYTDESLSPLVHTKWILFLIVALISGEWFIRKYSGGY